jgi:hypothetical protein
MFRESGKRLWVILVLLIALAMLTFPLWGRGIADPLTQSVISVVGLVLGTIQLALQLIPQPPPREFQDPLKQFTLADLQRYRHGDKEIPYVNRGATSVEMVEKNRRLLLTGRLGIGKTTEGITLAQIAHALGVVTSFWEPTVGFAKFDDRTLQERGRQWFTHLSVPFSGWTTCRATWLLAEA